MFNSTLLNFNYCKFFSFFSVMLFVLVKVLVICYYLVIVLVVVN